MKIKMRLSLLLCCFFVGSILYSQSFQGEYRSNKTSFKDEINPENSFIEETGFNILIVPKNEGKDGLIIIQGPRIPKKAVIYSIVDFLGEMDEGNRKLHLFKVKSEHISEEESIIVIYLNKEENLNLMVSNEESSQTFFNLKKLN